MAIRRILWYPDPQLMEQCAPVGDSTSELAELFRDLSDTMFAHNGAGLAAPQIGILKRVFVIDPVVAGLSEQDAPLLFVDPQIEWLSDETEVSDEGCLSFPGIYVPIRRALKARTRARDVEGKGFEVEGEGLFARAMQHEKDHLDGTLITDHVGRLKRKMIRRKMERETQSRDD
ncbi:MAG: peptide deformylase [Myxococcales bacterium]|nr:peptide deformylase [Myxococcales bacterium]